ncbi:phosphopantetheine-binding protein [Aquimarina aggregata]|uniref:phosphopantetheine-binding protein n=1 Tax=Aquimarina aggregata TaxID=1642818 RepID=UPI00248FB50A|nr:phosphopantetheine-binding protein [Aquimarina aggregata]
MKNEIVMTIRQNLLEIIPELEGQDFSTTDVLTDLGANSLDRGELITLTLERLDLDISRIEFVGIETIDELADKIIEKK